MDSCGSAPKPVCTAMTGTVSSPTGVSAVILNALEPCNGRLWEEVHDR